MKNLTTFAACVSMGTTCALAAPTSVTNALTFIEDTGNTSTKTLMSTNWTDGLEAHAGADYLIGIKGNVRLPETQYTFRGNSLQVGTDSIRPSFFQKSGNLTFENDGLYLKNMVWGNWSANNRPKINGRVTVLAKNTSPIQFNSDNANTSYEFTGPWFAEPDCGIELYVVSRSFDNHRLVLSGDLGGYRGSIRAYASSVLVLGDTDLPGSVVIDNVTGPAWLQSVTNTTATSIANLSLAANTKLVFQSRAASGTDPVTNNSFRVTSRLDIVRPVQIVVQNTLCGIDGAAGCRQPFLTLAAGAQGTLDVDDFVLSDASPLFVPEMETLEVETDETTGDRTLYVVRRPFVMMMKDNTTTDPSPTGGKASGYGGLTTTNYWSDSQIPHPGQIYHTNRKVLRTAADKDLDVFAGEALILDNQLVLQSRRTVISNLYVRTYDASKSHTAYIANWHANGDKTTNTFAAGGTKVLAGDRMVLQANMAHSVSGIGGYIRFEIPISGAGQLTFGVNDGAAGAYYEFAGDNSQWTGRLYSAPAISGTTRTAPSFDNTAELLFREPKHLGGPRSSFDYQAIGLQNGAVLHPLQSVTLDDATRGVRIYNNGGGIKVDAGHVFTLREQVTLEGPLTKLGEGTLALGGPVVFSANVTPQPVVVAAGALRPADTNALNGVTVKFTGTGALEADVSAEGEVATYGLYNGTLDNPFDVSGLAAGQVPVRMGLPDGFAENPFAASAAICTVNAAAAANLGVSAFAVARVPGMRISVTARENADGTVTYVAGIAPGGLIFCIR